MKGTTEAERREAAMATLATLVGALVLSRTVASPELSRTLLSAAAAELKKKPA
jgi:hypothetical protein